VITRIKKFLYRVMLKDSMIHPTVTSSDLPAVYRELFNLPGKEFHLLHDCYGKLAKYQQPFRPGKGYVFCGGTNGRDFESLVKIAGMLPEVPFVIAGPKKNTLGETFPSNISYQYDIPFLQFQELIGNCSILALPLKTQAPAGLIVLFTAGLMSKPVITSDNPTMREYIAPGDHGILVGIGDNKTFVREIRSLLGDLENQQRLGENLFRSIEGKGSPDAFIDTIIEIVRHTGNHEAPANQ
jgi:glycosyltransferase involved in cell wall biosynthesis